MEAFGYSGNMTRTVQALLVVLFLQCAGCSRAQPLGEDFVGVISMVFPADMTLYGAVLDRNNRANDSIQVQVCWDDPTFKNNCDKPVTANTVGAPYLSCAGKSVCHGFQYLPPVAAVGNVRPRDGKDHLMYVRSLSQKNPGIGDKPLMGSPWPFTFRDGAVAAMWTPNLETAPSRLTAAQLALFANSQDPYSVGSSGATVCTVNGTAVRDDGVVGYYAKRHMVPCANVFVVSLPVTDYITQSNLESTVLATHLSASIQAVALGWVRPAQILPSVRSDGPRSMSAVVANGSWVKGSLGSCGGERTSAWTEDDGPVNPYFNSASKAPFTDHRLRPTMLLAGETCPTCAANRDTYRGPWLADVPTAKATIDAAVAAVDTNPTGGNIYWALTADTIRSQTALFVSPLVLGRGLSPRVYAQVLGSHAAPYPADISSKNILVYDEGAAHWNYPGATFLPGAGIGFAVTSTSGYLPYDHNQTNVASWLQAGAVAAYGNAVEPCHQWIYKSPDPVILVANYLQGQTVVEALWKSVRLPWGANFVGDPLASPFSIAGAPSAPQAK